jgi:translation initiation factor 2 subunit 2
MNPLKTETKTKSFETMVDEAYLLLSNPSDDVLVLPDPECEITQTRLHWKNVKDYLKTINRPPSHFMIWIKSEMSDKQIDWKTDHVYDGILIQGKKLCVKYISTIARKYVTVFVTCPSCKSINTNMNKCSKQSYYEFECSDCEFTKNI